MLLRRLRACLMALVVFVPIVGATSAVLAALPVGYTCTGTCDTLGADGVVTLSPFGSTQYMYISTESGQDGVGSLPTGALGSETNGSLLVSPAFTANAGDLLKFYFNYITSDGAGFADYAWAAVADPAMTPGSVQYLVTARTQPTGSIIPGQGMPGVVSTLTPASVPIIGGGPTWSPLGGSSGACFDEGCGYTGWVQAEFNIPTAGTYVLAFGTANWADTQFDSGLAIDGATIGGQPIGALTTTKTADSATSAAGAQNGYTITVDNPNADPVSVTGITDALPVGFSYVAGSTTGVTTSDPAIVGQDLTWSGSFPITAGGSISLHFNVTVSSTAGTYFNEAGGSASGSSVSPTGPTAPITVTVNGNTPPSVGAGGPYNGIEGSPVSLDGTVTDPDAGDTLTTSWSYAAGAGVDAGATCSFADASAVDTTVTCTDDGAFVLTLTANDGVNSDVTATADMTLANADPSVHITAPADLSSWNVGASINLSAGVTDAGSNDTHTCTIDWGDGTVEPGTLSSGTCSGSHAYTAAGVFTVIVTATDDDLGMGSDEIMLVVSDQSTKVTGGGFIVQGGRTSFGFVVQDDGAGLRGQLQVRAPGHNRFHGDEVTALAVSSTTATWWGNGRWNGQEGYTFEVTVVDNGRGHKKSATPDQFSITIRDSANVVVFAASGPLKGGNITVH